MSIKVVWRDGEPTAICETAEEALALIRAGGTNVAQSKQQRAEAAHEQEPRSEGELVKSFFGAINPNSKRLLKFLARFPDGVEGDEFATVFGKDAESFGGIIGGASRIAKRSGLKIEDFVVSEQRFDKDKRRYRFLQPGPKLLAYKEELGGKE